MFHKYITCIHFEIEFYALSKIKGISFDLLDLTMGISTLHLHSDKGVLHGLRTPNEAFFHLNPKLLGLGRHIEQINSGTLGVFFGRFISTHSEQSEGLKIRVFQ